MRIHKNIKLFVNYFLGPVLFIWLSWSIYHQIAAQPELAGSWQNIKQALTSPKLNYFLLVVLLMLVHWGIEAYKWMLAINVIQKISFIRAFKAVLSGVSVSITTPNRVGEYLGRVLYIKEGNRIKAISLTIVCSMSQLITTLFVGVIALFFLSDALVASQNLPAVWIKVVLYVSIFFTLLFLLFYFRLAWLVKIIHKFSIFNRFYWVVEALEQFNATLLLRLLSLSISRFFIFILQYYLLFKFFGVAVSFGETLMTVSVMFLIMVFVPTIAVFTDLGLKNEISLKLLGLFSSNNLAVSLSLLSIWLINLVIPAVIGSLLILGIKRIIKNQNEIT